RRSVRGSLTAPSFAHSAPITATRREPGCCCMLEACSIGSRRTSLPHRGGGCCEARAYIEALIRQLRALELIVLFRPHVFHFRHCLLELASRTSVRSFCK